MSGPCLDCKDNHRCGVECVARKCFGGNCGCTASEIFPDLWQCNTCGIIICRNDDVFQKYLAEIFEYYNMFKEQHNAYLRKLEEKRCTEIPLSERDKEIYDIVDAFTCAKSNFQTDPTECPALNTISSRKNAFALIQAFLKMQELSL